MEVGAPEDRIVGFIPVLTPRGEDFLNPGIWTRGYRSPGYRIIPFVMAVKESSSMIEIVSQRGIVFVWLGRL